MQTKSITETKGCKHAFCRFAEASEFENRGQSVTVKK